jgi:hypothetical protein
MRTGLIGELESPSRARRLMSHAGARAHIRPSAKLVLCPKGVGGGHSTDDGCAKERGGGKDPCFVSAPHAGKRG